MTPQNWVYRPEKFLENSVKIGENFFQKNRKKYIFHAERELFRRSTKKSKKMDRDLVFEFWLEVKIEIMILTVIENPISGCYTYYNIVRHRVNIGGI